LSAGRLAATGGGGAALQRPGQAAGSAGAWQQITQPLNRQQRIERHDLHRIALTWQPTGQQSPITERQRARQLQQLAGEWQPALPVIV